MPTKGPYMNKIIVAAAMVLGMSAMAEDTKTAPAAPAAPAAATHEHASGEHMAPAAATAKMTVEEATKTCKMKKEKDLKACVEKLTKAM